MLRRRVYNLPCACKSAENDVSAHKIPILRLVYMHAIFPDVFRPGVVVFLATWLKLFIRRRRLLLMSHEVNKISNIVTSDHVPNQDANVNDYAVKHSIFPYHVHHGVFACHFRYDYCKK